MMSLLTELGNDFCFGATKIPHLRCFTNQTSGPRHRSDWRAFTQGIIADLNKRQFSSAVRRGIFVDLTKKHP